jgi:hypothetical protein
MHEDETISPPAPDQGGQGDGGGGGGGGHVMPTKDQTMATELRFACYTLSQEVLEDVFDVRCLGPVAGATVHRFSPPQVEGIGLPIIAANTVNSVVLASVYTRARVQMR